MKNYAIFLIYCIGRDIYSYWETTPYDEAYEDAVKVYDVFKRYYNKNDDLYLSVERFMSLSHLIPDDLNI